MAGERDPYELASYRHGRCKKSEQQIAQALEGNYRAEPLFALQQALEAYDFYGQQSHACDTELEAMYQACKARPTAQPAPEPSEGAAQKPTAFRSAAAVVSLGGAGLIAQHIEIRIGACCFLVGRYAMVEGNVILSLSKTCPEPVEGMS